MIFAAIYVIVMYSGDISVTIEAVTGRMQSGVILVAVIEVLQ